MAGKKQLEWSRRAETNLDAIFDYIATDNLHAAESVIALLLKTAVQLTDFPLMGHAGRRSGTRELPLHPRLPSDSQQSVHRCRIAPSSAISIAVSVNFLMLLLKAA